MVSKYILVNNIGNREPPTNHNIIMASSFLSVASFDISICSLHLFRKIYKLEMESKTISTPLRTSSGELSISTL